MHGARTIVLLAATVVAALAIGCSPTQPGGSCVPQGVFGYNGYDSLGTLIVTGQLRFNPAQGPLTGAWTLDLQPDVSPTDVGPQWGSGTLSGSLASDTLWLSLNPDQVDNNIFLFGFDRFNGDLHSFNGTWDWSTLRGETNHGTFTMVQQCLPLEPLAQ